MTYVGFCNTDCEPCYDFSPTLVQVKSDTGSRYNIVEAYVADFPGPLDTVDSINEFTTTTPNGALINYPILYSPSVANATLVMQDYQVNAIPISYVFDPAGNLCTWGYFNAMTAPEDRGAPRDRRQGMSVAPSRRGLLAATLAGLLSVSGSRAAAAEGRVLASGEGFEIALVGEGRPVAVNRSASVSLALRPTGGMHLNSRSPAKLKLAFSAGIEGPTTVEPTATDGVALFPVSFVARTIGDGEVRADLTFVVCSDRKCLRQERSVTVDSSGRGRSRSEE